MWLYGPYLGSLAKRRNHSRGKVTPIEKANFPPLCQGTGWPTVANYPASSNRALNTCIWMVLGNPDPCRFGLSDRYRTCGFIHALTLRIFTELYLSGWYPTKPALRGADPAHTTVTTEKGTHDSRLQELSKRRLECTLLSDVRFDATDHRLHYRDLLSFGLVSIRNRLLPFPSWP